MVSVSGYLKLIQAPSSHLSPLLPVGNQQAIAQVFSRDQVHFFESNSFMKCWSMKKPSNFVNSGSIMSNSVVSTRFCVKCCFVWEDLIIHSGLQMKQPKAENDPKIVSLQVTQ